MNSNSSQEAKKEDLSIQLQKIFVPQFEPVSSTNLQFDRLQPPNEIFIEDNKLEFGHFVAREAVLDEEYWLLLCFCGRQQHGCEQKLTGRIEKKKDMLIATKGNLQSRHLMH